MSDARYVTKVQHVAPPNRLWYAVQGLMTNRTRMRPIPHAHTNHAHPVGTAGHAIAPRHHGKAEV